MATAQTPRLLGVQGRLENSVGQALTGPQDLTFKIYTASTGGTQIASETETIALDDDGVYAATIGDTDVLDPADFAAELWLGVTVDLAGGGSELTPRIPLRAAAGSLRAAVAEGVDAEADLVMNGRKITGLAAPMADGDAVPRGYVGDLAGLSTAAQATLVAAVNEVACDVGAPASLNTTDKSNLVAAINDLLAHTQALEALLAAEAASHAAQIATLQAQVAALETKTAPLSISSGESGTPDGTPHSLAGDLLITGVNVHIRSGSGSTTGATNGTGNLVLGYNEANSGDLANRDGSHNLLLGRRHRYTSYSGLVGGQDSTISGAYASVVGGNGGAASGNFSVVVGGSANIASGAFSAVLGGQSNEADAQTAVAVGGISNDTGGTFHRVMVGDPGNTFLDGDEVAGVAAVTAIENDVTTLQSKTAPLTISTGESGTTTGDLLVTGVNVHLRSGAGSTLTSNGVGNLVLGYNEANTGDEAERGGSHNLVIGRYHRYRGNAGIVSGEEGNLLGNSAAVLAGWGNTAVSTTTVAIGGSFGTATGLFSSVLGGYQVESIGDSSVAVGGSWSDVTGSSAVVVGGYQGVASGTSAVAVGGNYGLASGASSVVVGGGYSTSPYRNEAAGSYSVAIGGSHNLAGGERSVVLGGSQNDAAGLFTLVAGGGGFTSLDGNRADGQFSVASGGKQNITSGTHSVIVGGSDGSATGSEAGVFGGQGGTASGSYSAVLGGAFNEAGGYASSTSGGSNNTASGDYSSISGGNANDAAPQGSSVLGGQNNVLTGAIRQTSVGDAGAVFLDSSTTLH